MRHKQSLWLAHKHHKILGSVLTRLRHDLRIHVTHTMRLLCIYTQTNIPASAYIWLLRDWTSFNFDPNH